MIEFREVRYKTDIPRNISCILAADVGGTNANFGIFNLQGEKPDLLFSLHYKSQKIKQFAPVVKAVIEYARDQFSISFNRAIFAAAGVVSENREWVKPTNLDFEVRLPDISKETGITCLCLVNDFEVIYYGLPYLKNGSVVTVHAGSARECAQRGVLGAGTGLGKSILVWDSAKNRYHALPSEGGHADFSPQHQIEMDLVFFMREREKYICNVSWEDVLSGNGIQRIYSFFHTNSHEHDQKEQPPHPDEIFNSRDQDKHARQTYELYTRLYARCAKNFALDALTLGGLYIAGGIAAHNVPLFQDPRFMAEFLNCGKQQHLLKEVPIHIITDYNVSLYGAAAYLLMKDLC